MERARGARSARRTRGFSSMRSLAPLAEPQVVVTLAVARLEGRQDGRCRARRGDAGRAPRHAARDRAHRNCTSVDRARAAASSGGSGSRSRRPSSVAARSFPALTRPSVSQEALAESSAAPRIMLVEPEPTVGAQSPSSTISRGRSEAVTRSSGPKVGGASRPKLELRRAAGVHSRDARRADASRRRGAARCAHGAAHDVGRSADGSYSSSCKLQLFDARVQSSTVRRATVQRWRET